MEMNGQKTGESMEISSNYSFNGVNETATPKTAKGAPTGRPDGDQDQVTLTNSNAVQQALENTPASRPDVVARARQLIADPDYPGSEVTGPVSQLIANKMLLQNE